MKYGLGGEIMKEFVGLRANAYSYLRDNNDEDKKVCHKKSHKKVCHERKLKFQDYKNCLEAAQTENKIRHSKKIKLR